MNSDLTYGRNFADFLGSFWSSIFDKGALGNAIGYASSEMLLQHYMDMMDVINSSSIYSTPIFTRKNVYPLVMSESEFIQYAQIPTYGDSGYYGPQPSNEKYLVNSTLHYGTPAKLSPSYFYPVLDSIFSFGSVAINRLFEPSVTLCNGSDFVYSAADGGIIFSANPFDNPLIPVNEVLNESTGEVDRQIIIWFCDVDLTSTQLHDQWGFIFTNFSISSQQYRDVIQNVFELVSQGPSLFRIDSFLSSISGSPLIREVSEIVQAIQDTPEGSLVITDKSVYSVASLSKIRGSIVVGAILAAGTPISNVIDVIDVTVKDWWSNLSSIPLKSGMTSNNSGYLAFPNVSTLVGYQNYTGIDPTHRGVYFSLIGESSVVSEFWATVDAKAKAANSTYGFDLFKKYSSSSSPLVDFSNASDFFVNPAQVLAEDLLPFSILPIKIKVSDITNLDTFFRTISPLKLTTPVHVILMLFLEVDLIDECDLASSENQSQTTSVNLDDLVLSNFGNYPSTEQEIWTSPTDSGIIEAVSIEVDIATGKKAGRSYKTPYFYSSNLDSMGFLIENFDLSNNTNLVQTLELRQIPKCAT